MATTTTLPTRSLITFRGVLASFGAIIGALTVFIDVVIFNRALTTPSALDPERSELAVCGSLVVWRILWHIISSANFIPDLVSYAIPACVLVLMYLSQSLTTLAPITSSSLAPSPRIRSLCAFAIYSWVPLGIVLLSASRTCEAAAPHAWADTRREVIYGGVTVLVVGALVILMVMAVLALTRRAAPAAVEPEKEGEGEGVAVEKGEKDVAGDAKV